MSPSAYVKSICTAIGPFHPGFQARVNGLRVAFSQAATAAQAKGDFQGFFSAVASDTSGVITRLKAAGAPNVTNGKAVASRLVSAFTQLRDALSHAAKQASGLPTTSLAAFRVAAGTVANDVGSSANRLDSSVSGLKSPELDKVQASEPACKSLTASG